MELYELAAVVFGSGGAAFTSVKLAFNGLVKSQVRMEKELGEVRKDTAENRLKIIEINGEVKELRRHGCEQLTRHIDAIERLRK